MLHCLLRPAARVRAGVTAWSQAGNGGDTVRGMQRPPGVFSSLLPQEKEEAFEGAPGPWH